jgi:hypothetical protein
VYEGVSEATAGQLLRVPADEEEKSALTEAKEFLLSELRRFPVSANSVKRSAREADISERTLKRAKQALGVRSEKEMDGSWTWSLPGEKAEGSQASTAGTLGTVGPLGKDANPQADDSAYLREESQGGQEGQVDHDEPRCDHGCRDGVGCYLCDPQHPYRLKQGSTA